MATVTEGGMRRGELVMMVANRSGGRSQFAPTIHWPHGDGQDAVINRCKTSTEFWMFKERFFAGDITKLSFDQEKRIVHVMDNAGGHFSVHYKNVNGFDSVVRGVRQWTDAEVFNYEHSTDFSKKT